MLRRISYLLLSLAILGTGIYGAKKLRYWERSVYVFKAAEAPEHYQRRGFGDRERFEREPRFAEQNEGRNREQFEGRYREQFEGRSREQTPGTPGSDERFNGRNPRERRSFEDNLNGRGHRNAQGFHGRKKISLRNVAWFLAVFAAFTVLIIYMDRGVRVLLKRKGSSGEI